MITDGNTRRKEMIAYLRTQKEPVSGTELARRFNVSRQVIVQDVALLRAENQDILSTNKGYMLYQPLTSTGCTCVIMTQHSEEQTIEEMESIVEYGGRMLDVFVDHDLYGQIRADLIINDMEDAREFCRKMEVSTSRPLKVLTGDCHYHTIAAPSEKVLGLIKAELKEKGILRSGTAGCR